MPVSAAYQTRLIALLMFTLTLIAGCGSGETGTRGPIDVHPEDTCAVCGMYLGDSPGPRAQAWVAGEARPLIFDSTRDFFAYALQPENQAGLQQLYVQDTAIIDWQHPTGTAASFIDARHAVYVVWQPLPGSMGPTLAPFAMRTAAEAFARAHGGAIFGFDQVTLALVAKLNYRCPAKTAGTMSAQQCLANPTPVVEPSASTPRRPERVAPELLRSRP